MNNRFNPRTPCGVRPAPAFCPSSFLRFQSTHSLRSATPVSSRRGGRSCVSIHALLAECDAGFFPEGGAFLCFNPRTPCGVRQTSSSRSTTIVLFQSTHSLRSATFVKIWDCPSTMFQSTHSLRSATRFARAGRYRHGVSIHALLAECDCMVAMGQRTSPSFNPRTPCGVRPPYKIKNQKQQ